MIYIHSCLHAYHTCTMYHAPCTFPGNMDTTIGYPPLSTVTYVHSHLHVYHTYMYHVPCTFPGNGDTTIGYPPLSTVTYVHSHLHVYHTYMYHVPCTFPGDVDTTIGYPPLSTVTYVHGQLCHTMWKFFLYLYSFSIMSKKIGMVVRRIAGEEHKAGSKCNQHIVVCLQACHPSLL